MRLLHSEILSPATLRRCPAAGCCSTRPARRATGPAGQGGDRGPSLAVPTFVHGNTDAGSIPERAPPEFAARRCRHSRASATPRSGNSSASCERCSLRRAGDGSQAPSIGDAATGQTLFFGRAGCANRHEVNGRGGIVGPDLSNAGRLPEAALHQAIVDPGNPWAGGRGSRGRASGGAVRVIMKDGREIRGVRRNEDTFSLQMVDESGQLAASRQADGSFGDRHRHTSPARVQRQIFWLRDR